MTMYYYRDADGRYVGAFDTRQDGLIECEPPQDARQIWDDAAGAWGVAPTAFPPLTARQLWLAAYRTMALKEDDVIAMTATMEDQDAAEELRIEIRTAREYERDHPAMDDLAALVGLPVEQFNALWRWSATL